MDECLLDCDGLAARLSVSRSTAERMVRDGTIPYRRVRGRKRFFWPDVLAALPSTTVEPPGRAVGSGQGAHDLVGALKQRARAYRAVKGGR